ncbi:MAG TPA: precorrin-4 C(11)-methyltransferase, partial [Anaerolineae bacterium]|nr:precorrin-4 C(11)-methyltransferase [Anaerolineae bacterium]
MSELCYTATPGTVYFIGAGPGAPDLITVRGRDLIAQADLILYADSLVEESVASLFRKAQARVETSSNLHLEQILALMVETAQAGGIVARIHSGDPALYGAVHEQMAYLEDHHIPYEVVPGVTAAFAAAAELKTELTVPDVVQTIILTRTAGRTTMPEGEDLKTLAAPGASLAIYLSVSRIRQVVDDLLASGGYGPETPVAVHHKVTWPDQSHVIGTLADIVEKVKAVGYTKHALILVSPALDPELKGKQRRTSSHLYDKTYTHRFRRAENFQRGKERQEATGTINGVVLGEKHLGHQANRQGCVVIALTKRGSQLARSLGPALAADVTIPAKFSDEQLAINNEQLTINNPPILQ